MSASRYAQFPRFEQEFLARGADLGLPISDEIAAGVSFRMFGQLDASVTAFARFLSDVNGELINKFPDLGETVGRFDSGRTEGLELSLHRGQGRIQMWMAFTALRAQASKDGVDYLRNSDQPYRLDLSGVYLLGERWEPHGSTCVPPGSGSGTCSTPASTSSSTTSSAGETSAAKRCGGTRTGRRTGR